MMTTPTRYQLWEGSAGSGKSFTAGLTAFFRIFNSPAGHDQYVMVSESQSSGIKMLIEDPTSFYNIFRSVCEFKGGSNPHIIIKGRYSTKRLYIGGFSNSASWKKILGLNLFGIWVEEGSIAHDDFIAEMFVRATRLRHLVWVLITTNPGYPDQAMYKDYFDKGYINEEHNQHIPQITLDYISETEEYDDEYEFIHFNHQDSPVQDEETVNRLARTFKPGDFWYNSKYLGARGYMEGAIYSPYQDRSKQIVSYDTVLDDYNFIKFTIGVDVGVRDQTVFTLVGFTTNFKYAIAIDRLAINEVGADTIWHEFTKWYDDYYKTPAIHGKMGGLYFDSGGGGLILRKTLAGKLMYKYNLQSANAHKKRIIDRVEFGVKMFSADRMLFTDRAEDTFNSYSSITYNKNREKTDVRVFTSHHHKDNVDSHEYGISPYFEYMIRKS